jgi:hypothetical protein
MPSPILEQLFGDAVELTAAINQAPFVPGIIAGQKLFSEKGIATTAAFIEFKNGKITLVPSAPRGGVAQIYSGPRRTGIELPTVHLPVRSSVLADEVQDKRAFADASLESAQELKQSKLDGMRQDLEATLEYHRAGAIRGQVLDADGSVLLDVYSEFGVSQELINFATATPATNLLQKVIDAERKADDALPGIKPSGYIALASPDFIDALRAHGGYMNALQFASPSELLDGGTIRISRTTFIEYRSTEDGPVFVPEGEAYLIPQGVPDLLITRFAPGDYNEAVNTAGLPIYAKAAPMMFDKGYALEAQTNVLNVPTRPKAIIKLVKE